MPNVGIKVPGILAPATVNGTYVNLAPYFTGMLASTWEVQVVFPSTSSMVVELLRS